MNFEYFESSFSNGPHRDFYLFTTDKTCPTYLGSFLGDDEEGGGICRVFISTLDLKKQLEEFKHWKKYRYWEERKPFEFWRGTFYAKISAEEVVICHTHTDEALDTVSFEYFDQVVTDALIFMLTHPIPD